ncbi:hypothetical protein [Bordetella genomosp. 1]|uniref:hypothetical protein n=1 Tax=Bordetella genomosp. 1 TaxID=1395607 RepID=UPI0011789DFA|nr:hypothetical protein [Bordetella genomosp. 1]
MTQFDIIRSVFRDLDPAASHEVTTPPDIAEVYTPSDHESALDADRALVVGDRGMGKTFWVSALADSSARSYLNQVYSRLKLDLCDVRIGFAGVDMAADGAISQEVFDEQETRKGYRPELIWRAVIFRAAETAIANSKPMHGTFTELLQWADADAERFQSALRELDRIILASGRKVVILFDALDRLGSSWAEIRRRTLALMRVTLAFRAYSAIRLKIFMRTDQALDPAIFSFPDASKLTQGRVNLSWERRDLYGLAFSRLVLADPARQAFSDICRESVGFSLDNGANLPNMLKHDEPVQQEVFSAMAGQYMGSDWRKGKTYAWLHNHLADAHGRVSPRSFLVALGAAARNRPEPTKVFDPRGLQIGVQAASEARVNQLAEEFPWIKAALEPLADLRVPATRESFIERWDRDDTVKSLVAASTRVGHLVPVEFGDTPTDATSDQLLQALQRIGVAETRPDGRINMPDIFRVASKLLKKGGIPVSSRKGSSVK